MKSSVRWALGTAAVGVLGSLFMAGATLAGGPGATPPDPITMAGPGPAGMAPPPGPPLMPILLAAVPLRPPAGGMPPAAGAVPAGFLGAGPGPGRGPMGPMAGPVMDMLKAVDKNNDGALSQDEINSWVDSRYAAFDADKDGRLSLAEFQALWADLTRPVAVRAFQFLDPNGDAQVARTELDDRFGTLVKRLDRNGDGVLSPDDRPDHGWRGHRPGGHGWDGPEE